MSYLEADLTPVYLTFVDVVGREWRALALVAPLSSEDMDPAYLGDMEELELKVRKVKIVRG